jgi:two-component system, NarL family, invasion response regulator UvrY
MIRVLIADDHEILRDGLRYLLLHRLGDVTTGEAKDAGEAITLLAQQDWDLVLLDINLPGRNGLEVLQEAKRLRPKLPVLVLTYYSEEQYALRALKLGASGYLNKQSACEELVVAVKRILAGGKYVSPTLAERLASNFSDAYEQDPHETLSQRELCVLRMVAVGKSIREIATELSLSEKTVATYRSRIAQKTGLKTNVEIARYALKHTLVE